MNDSELPEAAIEAVANLWVFRSCHSLAENRNVARAVLVAATERIECPATTRYVDYLSLEPVHHHKCACAGSGVLFVLKTEKP